MKKIIFSAIIMCAASIANAQFTTENLLNDPMVDKWDGKEDGKIKYEDAVTSVADYFKLNDENEAEKVDNIPFTGKTAEAVYGELKDWLTNKVDQKNITCQDDNKKIKLNYYSESVGVILKLTTDTKIHTHFNVIISVTDGNIKVITTDLEYLQVKTAILQGGWESDLVNAKHLPAKDYRPFKSYAPNPMEKGYALACCYTEKMKTKIEKILSE